jgi:hypothetical protein
VRLRFLTSTPQNIREGSGTFAGISTLRRALEAQGVQVEMATPARRWPSLTAGRLWFNHRLKPAPGFDAVVGFDMDGYTLAGRNLAPHIAAIKGVIADEKIGRASCRERVCQYVCSPSRRPASAATCAARIWS